MQSAGDAQTSKSGLRRRAVRNTWMPRVNEQPGLRAQFVVGRPIKASAISLFRRERNLKQDFLFLDFQVRPLFELHFKRARASLSKQHRQSWFVQLCRTCVPPCS